MFRFIFKKLFTTPVTPNTKIRNQSLTQPLLMQPLMQSFRNMGKQFSTEASLTKSDVPTRNQFPSADTFTSLHKKNYAPLTYFGARSLFKQNLLFNLVNSGKFSTSKRDEQMPTAKDKDFLINIAGLDKIEIIIALFNNVYKKSLGSIHTWGNIAERSYYDKSQVPIGINRAPTKDEISQILLKNKKIGYIGAVKFDIDFSGDTINTKYYDQEHETQLDLGFMTAKDCIENLRKQNSLKTPEKNEAKEELKDDYNYMYHIGPRI